jgi:hypothetical protein
MSFADRLNFGQFSAQLATGSSLVKHTVFFCGCKQGYLCMQVKPKKNSKFESLRRMIMTSLGLSEQLGNIFNNGLVSIMSYKCPVIEIMS